jgi:hypothetical protein
LTAKAALARLKALAASACLTASACAFADNPSGLTAAKINQVIEAGQSLDTNYRVNSEVSADTVSVRAWLKEASRNREQDCKIDAVLMAKKIIDAFPEITKVTVSYYDRHDSTHQLYYEVIVVAGIVKVFAQGLLPQDQLLATLPLTIHKPQSQPQSSQAQTQPSPVLAGTPTREMERPSDGAMLETRQVLFDRIKHLEQEGVGTSPFKAEFAAIEASAGRGDAGQAQSLITTLSQHLTIIEEDTKKRKDRSVAIARTLEVLGEENKKAKDRQLELAKATVAAYGEPGAAGQDLAGQRQHVVNQAKACVEGMKKDWGDLWVAPGPKFPDRYRIAQKLRDIKNQHQDITRYMTSFHDMERSAANENAGLLDQEIRELDRQLGLKEVLVDENYKKDQANSDFLKKMFKSN